MTGRLARGRHAEVQPIGRTAERQAYLNLLVA